MKQTKNDAVATVENVQPIDVDTMKTIIGEDLNRAEVGRFCMLRAGVGLLCYKGMSEFGEWESRLMELCPGKSPRTLQGYMKIAKDCLIERGISPERAWEELRKFDAASAGNLIMAAPEALQIGAGEAQPAAPAKRGGKKANADAAPAPVASDQTFSQMLIDFIQQRKAARPKSSEPAKPLTKKEKVEAAIAEAARIVNMTADWIADGTWGLLPDEELESTMSGLRAASDRVTKEFKSRK